MCAFSAVLSHMSIAARQGQILTVCRGLRGLLKGQLLCSLGHASAAHLEEVISKVYSLTAAVPPLMSEVIWRVSTCLHTDGSCHQQTRSGAFPQVGFRAAMLVRPAVHLSEFSRGLGSAALQAHACKAQPAAAAQGFCKLLLGSKSLESPGEIDSSVLTPNIRGAE